MNVVSDIIYSLPVIILLFALVLLIASATYDAQTARCDYLFSEGIKGVALNTSGILAECQVDGSMFMSSKIYFRLKDMEKEEEAIKIEEKIKEARE